jgi:hypothetical protein
MPIDGYEYKFIGNEASMVNIQCQIMSPVLARSHQPQAKAPAS